MIRLAINGFGRIGRLAFRRVMEMEEFEVVAINDLTSPDMLAYLLKYDSVQGTYLGHTVENDEESIIVDGKKITIYKELDARNLPWGELEIDVVLECTGFYTSKEKSKAHLDAGAKKVLISAPAGNDLKTIVYGVNHETLTSEDRIVSGASCTTNCLAPMAKALADYRELRTGFMTTIHAYTGNQKILDAPDKGSKFRRSRAAAINIVPTTTGAAQAIGNSRACRKVNWICAESSSSYRIHYYTRCYSQGRDRFGVSRGNQCSDESCTGCIVRLQRG